MLKNELIPPGRAKDITGERFGRLVVLGRTHNIGKDTAWLCECDCGNYKVVRTSGLKSGDYVSCGCRRAELNTPDDIKGQRFGRLVALEILDKRTKSGDAYWKCECDCGNITEVSKNRLSNGTTKSCGCLQRELISLRAKKQTKDIAGKRFGIVVAISPTSKRNDANVVWRCRCDCGNEFETTAHNLLRGGTASCGCKKMKHIIALGLNNKGERNPAYNHNLSDEQRATTKFQRTSDRAKKLRQKIYKRDKFRCVVCGKESRKLIAHHLESFADNESKRFNPDNLVTLCGHCHKEFHNTYGYGKNTKEQFNEFTIIQKESCSM